MLHCIRKTSMNLFSMFRRAQVIVSSLQAAAPVPHAPTINAVEEYCSNLIAANAGGGSAHSLMNPYLVVKFWKRAA